jgi:hypothetical protein
MTAIKQVQRRAVERHAHRAVAERLGRPAPDAVRAVIRDPERSGTVLLDLNSGGNGIAAQGALEDAGYRVDWLGTAPSGYGVRLRVTALED